MCWISWGCLDKVLPAAWLKPQSLWPHSPGDQKPEIKATRAGSSEAVRGNLFPAPSRPPSVCICLCDRIHPFCKDSDSTGSGPSIRTSLQRPDHLQWPYFQISHSWVLGVRSWSSFGGHSSVADVKSLAQGLFSRKVRHTTLWCR